MRILFLALAFFGAGCFAPLLQAQSPSSQPNSLVRFRYFHGSTVVGEMTVELFDQAKPVTVRNFLRYVREGTYDNLILQRCVPNYVIQAGSARSFNALSTASFLDYLPTQRRDPIPNEFAVGPVLHNVYGTLAMAKAADDANSATTDWFFNLADNSQQLDHENGGYTVFGRVVSGTNILNLFNRTNRNLGIYYSDSPVFGELPVAYNPTTLRKPRYVDIYHVQVTLVTTPADSTRPTLQIASPAADARLSTGTVTVSGKAADNVEIGVVRYSINDEQETSAAGTTDWMAVVQLRPGTNKFYAQSVDTAGRRSPLMSRTLFWSVPEQIGVQRIGNGSITGPTNRQTLEINRNYTLTAVPAAGQVFYGWTGVVSGRIFSTNLTRFAFAMQSNSSLHALFVPNPFPPLQGNYVGTVLNSNFIDAADLRLDASLGSLTFAVTSSGKVSGKLKQGGGSFSFSGSFGADGNGRFTIPRTGAAPLVLGLQLDVTNASSRVTGYVTDNFLTWLARVQVGRAAVGTVSRPVPWTGRYTVALPGGTNDSIAPPGYGPVAVTVNSGGTLSLAGKLPDGTPLTYSTSILNDGSWPLYLPLYAGKGVVFSWSQFDTNQSSEDVLGRFVWIKHSPTTTGLYPNGFVVISYLFGSVYRPPVNISTRLLPFVSGRIALVSGDLPSSLANTIGISPGGSITNLGPNKLTLTITRTNGLFSGSMTPVGSSKAISFAGAILQKQNYGVGYFPGTNRFGLAYLGE